MRLSARAFAAALCAVLTAAGAHAQNLITTNPSFESNGPLFIQGPQTNNTAIPGFVLSASALNSFVGVDNNQGLTTGRDGANFGYVTGGPGTATIATATTNRGAATAGTPYTFSFLALNDLGSPNTIAATATIDFFDAGGALIASTPNVISPTNTGNGTNRAFQSFNFTAVAPALTATAGVSFGTTAGGQYLFDNFSLTPVPEPVTTGLLAGTVTAGLAVVRRRRQSA